MQGSAFIDAQLARRAYIDGFEDGLTVIMAVAFVFRNRVNAGWFGGSWVDVLGHFRDSSSQTEQDPETLPDPRVYSFQCLLQEIDGIFSGQRTDDITVPTQPSFVASAYKPALFYGRLNRITNDWFLENISRNTAVHDRIAQVGALT